MRALRRVVSGGASGALGALRCLLLLLEHVGLGLLRLRPGLLAQGLEALGAAGLLGLAGLLQPVVADHSSGEFLAEADELVAQAAEMVELQVADPHTTAPVVGLSSSLDIYPFPRYCKLRLATANCGLRRARPTRGTARGAAGAGSPSRAAPASRSRSRGSRRRRRQSRPPPPPGRSRPPGHRTRYGGRRRRRGLWPSGRGWPAPPLGRPR